MYKQTEVNKVLLTILFILSAIIIFTSSHISSAVIALSINLVIAVLFYSMTVGVSGNKIYWYFGFGFLRKEMELSDIVQTSLYETKWYQGIGIRMLKDGWLYNASVGKALQLTLTSGKNVHLGCKDWKGLQHALNSTN
ncbi:hypothetical protein [Vibrio parahaemolyticus]|uniref:hypothetical protein n=1 Tax=Vibrio parahaemolyticus TaxID=670 RepID=UPI000C86B713|nr:hypothetical protein [Vibrio parahaemolyticus]PMT58814.1 hypothetical protein C1S87_24485 [Vibrio parahaemolyticus]PMT83935.1 hypothetical protein C1S83_24870 [Vibrio parahaemolyticus]PMT85474.1 hypothetical protein C1T03_24900 [Vibrio parahaemolyticus]HCG8565382.1 hypothetical protein [Vibrio parahaemolyticus]HCG9584548.1 hypothetical protein [Vibrio parahaemolyticus]